MTPLELWGGVECTINRVGDRYHDQCARSGHDLRLTDLDRFFECGFRVLRHPVLWERVAPDAPGVNRWDPSDSQLARLRSLGVRPIVGLLHHGSGPRYTSLVDPQFPALFATYAAAVADRYPWVSDWTPINEPLTTARFSALYGHWYPHATDDRAFVAAFLNQLRAIVLAMAAVRRVNPDARLIQTEDCGQSFGTRRLASQRAFEEGRRWLTWDVLAGRVDRHHPMAGYLRANGARDEDLDFFVENACPASILGLNYYLTSDRWLDERVTRYPAASHGGNAELRYADVEAVRARDEGIAGHRAHLLAAWQRYNAPLALTEVHLGCTREEQLRWLVEAWRGAEAARAEGADVRAVTAWALLGSHDWDSLATAVCGHYEPGVFDTRSTPPRPTALAKAAIQIASQGHPQHPVLATDGWWRRSGRLMHSLGGVPSTEPSEAPRLLIVGSRGTLGQAFRHVCARRGLATHLASRADMDMSDSGSVDAMLRRIKPWAVINAAGYVRVDDAESDAEACRRDNLTGPVTLAAACRRRELPFVTFSSDLVFNGRSQQPYVESDATAPLNVYGAAKAEADRRVLDVLPDALVVRTSAFFGPWDQHNFATQLFNAVSRNQQWRAAVDYTVSPTYVPDLVDAVLDLLIDGERGIWHLANQGAVTWFEFGRSVAEAMGVSPALVTPAAGRDVWQPAIRPAYSVLGSERGLLLRPLAAAVAAYSAEVARSDASLRASS